MVADPDQARGLAANVLHTAENLIHSSTQKAQEVADGKGTDPVSRVANIASAKANEAADVACARDRPAKH